MHSIFLKIFALLTLFNLALWAFVLVFDDYVELEVRHVSERLSSDAVFWAMIVQPIIGNDALDPFGKLEQVQLRVLAQGMPNADRLQIYRFDAKPTLRDNFRYFPAINLTNLAPIRVTHLPPVGSTEESLPSLIERMFEYFKPLLDNRALTPPMVPLRARFSPQSEVVDWISSSYRVRTVVPVKDGLTTIGLVELWDDIDIREAYIGRNNIRLTLLGGLSVLTIVLGVVLAFSIAFPLRQLARRLDQKLTPTDMATQLQNFSIAGLHDRRDEIGSLHKNLLKMTDQITKLFAEKEQFAAEVSHELKNPIASIIAYSENLPTDMPTTVAGNLEKIKAQAERMNYLVSEISEAAIVDNDLVTKKRVRFDLREVVREIGEHYQNTNLYPQVVIELDLPSKAPMNGLPDRVGQVIVNLLDNAISFVRPKGTVRIRVQSHWRKGPTLIVEDSGPGVREEMRDAVFTRFFSSRVGEAAKPNSSGLGLHICKQIVEAHGGQITISNSDLGGAKFDIFWR